MKYRAMIAAICLYVLAIVLMRVSVPSGVHREAIYIDGPDGKPCLGTIWTPPTAKAVILVGHGIASNRSVMALTAKTFARNGFTAVTFDFWGHGQSREKFRWTSNAAQIHAWCAWARQHFPGLPLAYLGHSMGGFSGGEAFQEKCEVDAFVAFGALPGHVLGCKTLVAIGRFEEQFSPDEARHYVGENVDIVSSPFSDHMLEVVDPLLLRRIVTWVNGALGFERESVFPWISWVLTLAATSIGCVATFMLAASVAAMFRGPAQPASPQPPERPWSLNPCRLAGRMLGYRGSGIPLRSLSFPSAVVSGLVFGAVFVLFMSWILNGNVFTCSLNHPSRCVLWLILIPFMALPLSLGGWATEQVALPNARARFAVSAVTRAVPLLLFTAALRLLSPHLAFICMLLVVVTMVLVMLSAIHATATRSGGDYRAGIVASSIVCAWLLAFYVPIMWG